VASTIRHETTIDLPAALHTPLPSTTTDSNLALDLVAA
jgi:hypothetical protein